MCMVQLNLQPISICNKLCYKASVAIPLPYILLLSMAHCAWLSYQGA